MISTKVFSPGLRHVKRRLPTFSMTTILPLRAPVDAFNCTSQTMQDHAHKKGLTYIHTYDSVHRHTHNPHFPRDPMIGWLLEATMCKETRIWCCKKLDSDHGPLSVQESLDEIQKTVRDNVILMHMCFTSLSWCRWVGCSNDGSSVRHERHELMIGFRQLWLTLAGWM